MTTERPHGDSRAPRDLKQLTSLRFFAAMWVVAFDYWPSLTGGGHVALVEKGYLGVELFFVLSGFILAHVYLDEARGGRLKYGDFLWARLARIYPLHLATLGAIGAMGAAALAMGVPIKHPVLVWGALPQNLLLIHAWGTTSVSAWNHASWSISAEWFAYVFFPLFAWAAWGLRARPLLAVLGALALVAAVYPAFEAAAGFPLTRATTGWGALRIVPCFTLGCAIDLLWRRRPLEGAWRAAGLAAASVVAIGMGATLHAPDLVLVMLFGALIFGLACMAGAGSRLLTAGPLVYLGEVSFAVYMVAVPWRLAFSKAAAKLGGAGDVLPPGLWLLQFGGVVVAAVLLHHLVERPARVWLRLHPPFKRRRARTTLPASAVATL